MVVSETMLRLESYVWFARPEIQTEDVCRLFVFKRFRLHLPFLPYISLFQEQILLSATLD